MIKKIGFSEFQDEFCALGSKNPFSLEGLGALWDYLEQYEKNVGEEFVLDVKDICDNFREQHWSTVAFAHNLNFFDDPKTGKDRVLRNLREYTTVCGELEDGSFVFRAFGDGSFLFRTFGK